MTSLEPPACGAPEPQQPVPHAGAPRLFEARHQPREGVTIVVVGGIGAVVVGTGVVLLAGSVLAQGPFGRGPFPPPAGVFRVVSLIMLAFFVAFGAGLAAAVVSGLVRALRRTLILRIDADGVTLERRRWYGRDRFMPWSAVRGLGRVP